MTAKRLGGIFVGLIVGFIVIMGVEMATHMIWPPPAGLDIRNLEHATKIVEAMPATAKWGVVLAWFLGTFAGAWTANRISGWTTGGWVIAGLSFAGVAWSLFTIPHPGWMVGAGLIAPILAGWLASHFGRSRATL